MNMDVISTDHTFQYPQILCITYLDTQLTTPFLNITSKNWMAIFRHSDKTHH
ncbi:hypothetical protein NTGM5_670033 [Candidatus Nitrotoga sp. M5]|nr:hypothetical protein NTGM5_670033 [Candidatus Nitrotoga sp. M5]